MSLATVTVEFYGLPRARAGCPSVVVSAATVGAALAAVVEACPSLVGLRQEDGRLSSQYLLSLDGERFLTDLDHPLQPGDRLLLLSADAGG
jgi:molybdopterin converting factor small subunit